jgi:hypothetical protein
MKYKVLLIEVQTLVKIHLTIFYGNALVIKYLHFIMSTRPCGILIQGSNLAKLIDHLQP